MGHYVFKLPDVGEGIAESEVATWRVAVGDVVAEDQPLVDMLTDKAAVEIPSPVAGRVLTLYGQAGDKIAVGAPLIVIETDASAQSAAAEPTAEPTITIAPAPANLILQAPAIPPSDRKPQTSPAVRKLARELGIELDAVIGTGPRGRITREDVRAHIPARTQSATVAAAPAVGGVETIKIIGLRRRIAEAMQRAKQRIPHFAYVEELDVTELEALRSHLNDTRRPELPKLTLLPFLIKALVRTLPRFPQVNSTYDEEAGIARRYAAVHCGIATQTPNGLIVPVLRHAETLDVWQMAAEIRRLADAARAGKAGREELSGSTITITSLGALGGIASTPVINAPEVAIVGVNKIVERAVFQRGAVVPRMMMNLSSSFDHRIVDGYDAASFIQAVKNQLEHPGTLFMA